MAELTLVEAVNDALHTELARDDDVMVLGEDVGRRAAGRNQTPVSPSFKEQMGLKDLIGESRELLAALKRILAVARYDASVLITGETGTGKELCARAIHYLSGRADKAFAPVNCGAIPLGISRKPIVWPRAGRVYGANSTTPGLLRASIGGTVLLDEIDALPLSAQVKLLRFLQDRQFQALGLDQDLHG